MYREFLEYLVNSENTMYVHLQVTSIFFPNCSLNLFFSIRANSLTNSKRQSHGSLMGPKFNTFFPNIRNYWVYHLLHKYWRPNIFVNCASKTTFTLVTIKLYFLFLFFILLMEYWFYSTKSKAFRYIIVIQIYQRILGRGKRYLSPFYLNQQHMYYLTYIYLVPVNGIVRSINFDSLLQGPIPQSLE